MWDTYGRFTQYWGPWQYLMIQGPTCRCRQLCFLLVWIASNCLTELILLVSLMLDLSLSVRRESKILRGWHWLLINGLLYLVLSFPWFTGCFCCQLRSCSKRRPWRMIPLPQMQWLEHYFTSEIGFSFTRCIGYLTYSGLLVWKQVRLYSDISVGPTFLIVLRCWIQLVGRTLWCHEW